MATRAAPASSAATKVFEDLTVAEFKYGVAPRSHFRIMRHDHDRSLAVRPY